MTSSEWLHIHALTTYYQCTVTYTKQEQIAPKHGVVEWNTFPVVRRRVTLSSLASSAGQPGRPQHLSKGGHGRGLYASRGGSKEAGGEARGTLADVCARLWRLSSRFYICRFLADPTAPAWSIANHAAPSTRRPGLATAPSRRCLGAVPARGMLWCPSCPGPCVVGSVCLLCLVAWNLRS